MIDINTKSFRTDDISLASFLLTQGTELLKIEKDSRHRYYFVLSDIESCKKLKNQYLNNAVAPAQILLAKREMLINEIKSKTIHHT